MAMTSSALESEDLDNVQLVRMEDVQPSREGRIEVLETCIIDHIDYDTEFVVDDDDSNIGSMVSIDSEDVLSIKSEVVKQEPPECSDVIAPAALNEIPVVVIKQEEKTCTPDRWPTLEILPGGIIKPADKIEQESTDKTQTKYADQMIYVCAKCSQSFKVLDCLVKHVKWHEIEQKKKQVPNVPKINSPKKEVSVSLQSGTPKIVITKSNRKKVPKRLKS